SRSAPSTGLGTGFDELRVNGSGVEPVEDFPFVLSLSKHEPPFSGPQGEIIMEAKLLRVDLTTGEIRTEILPHSLFERWVGGSGINDWILWEHFQRHDIMCDPRGPDNIFIFGIGPVAGTGSGIGVKGRITFKSPEYGHFADSAGGGKFPYMVRFTGYDHIAVTGKAPKPVYLHICNDEVTICDASHLWGKNTSETHTLLREELGDYP